MQFSKEYILSEGEFYLQKIKFNIQNNVYDLQKFSKIICRPLVSECPKFLGTHDQNVMASLILNIQTINY